MYRVMQLMHDTNRPEGTLEYPGVSRSTLECPKRAGGCEWNVKARATRARCFPALPRRRRTSDEAAPPLSFALGFAVGDKRAEQISELLGKARYSATAAALVRKPARAHTADRLPVG